MAQETSPKSGPARILRRRQPLVLVLVFAAAGILFDRYCPVPILCLFGAGVAFWIAWLIFYRCGWLRPATVLILCCVASLAAAWHHYRWHLCRADDLGLMGRRQAAPILVRGIVHDGPRFVPAPGVEVCESGGHVDVRINEKQRVPIPRFEEGDQTRLILRIQGVHDGSRWQPASGRSWVIVDGHTLGLHAGDGVHVFGRLVAPEPPANPGDFDEANYHRRRGRKSILLADHPDGISRVSAGSPFYFWRMVEWLRSYCEAQLQRYLSTERAPLAMAVLLGAREQLEFDEKEDFRTTGTMHLMAISGLHVSILASLFLVLARTGIMPVVWALLAAMVITVLYALVADPRPPVVRATILTWVMCLAWHLGREAFSFNTLAAAGLAVLALNPCDLFNEGAQLSFLAVGVLAWFAVLLLADASDDPLKRLLAESRPWPVQMLRRLGGWTWKLTLASLAVWFVSMPLVAYHFHVFSPVAVLLTPLLWLPVTLLLYSGFAVIACGWLCPPAAMLFGVICNAMLWLLTACVDGARSVPAGHFWVPGPPLWWLVGFYGWLLFLVVFPAQRPSRAWCWGITLSWMLLGAVVPRAVDYVRDRGEEQLTATFISVGHGTSVLLELPDGRTVLYDAGGLGLPRRAADSVSAVLWSRDLRRIDALVLSHADSDHYNAVPRLLGRFSVGAVYMPPHMVEAQQRSLRHLRNVINETGIPLHRVTADDACLLSTDSVRIEVLHPPEPEVGESDNENSVVLLVEFAGRRILLPGDLDGAGMQAVLAGPPVDCDVMMAPHHGRRARTAESREFFDWCRPEIVVISSRSDTGANWRDALPSEYQQGALHTAWSGAVTVTLAGERTRVDTWLDEPPTR